MTLLRKPLTHQRFFLSNPKGFTLLEVMIAIGLVAGVITLFVSSVGNNNNQIKESVRELSVLSREIYYKAKLNQATYRLVIDMKEGPDSKLKHTYWVEKGDKSFLVSNDSLSESLKEQADEDEDDDDDEDKAPPNDGFTVDTRTLKKPKSLASGIIFSGVEIVGQESAFDSGKVFIHYLPQGFVEETAIHLKYSDKLQWTMAIHPLTGRADVYPEDISLKEIRDQ